MPVNIEISGVVELLRAAAYIVLVDQGWKDSHLSLLLNISFTFTLTPPPSISRQYVFPNTPLLLSVPRSAHQPFKIVPRVGSTPHLPFDAQPINPSTYYYYLSSTILMAPRRQLTAFEKTIPDYRKRILISLAKAFIVPPLLTTLALRILCRSLPLFIYLPLLLLSIPIAIGLRSQYTLWSQDKEAARMGAKPITRVRGRWPGNLDVVLRLVKSFESGYVLQGFSDLFAEYDCTTLNTRFFWDDQVSAPARPPPFP